jgi:hypothetical protein
MDTSAQSSGKSSSHIGLWSIIVLLLLAIAGVGAYVIMSASGLREADTKTVATIPTAMTTMSPSPSPSPSAQSTGLSTGVSDSDLSSDEVKIDTQLNSVNSELQTVDQGLHDTPEDLSQ